MIKNYEINMSSVKILIKKKFYKFFFYFCKKIIKIEKMVLKIYIDFISQPSRAILSFLLLNQIPFELIEIQLMKGEHLTPEFEKINPVKKVPAIIDDDFELFESHAILRYLSKKYKTADHWYPSDPKKMALVDRYLDWHHSNLRQGSSSYVFFTLFPNLNKKNVDLNELKILLDNSLDMIDKFFLGKNKFIAGDEISIADLSCACEIVQQQLIGTDISKYLNINKWLDNVLEIKEVKEAHKQFYKAVNEFGIKK